MKCKLTYILDTEKSARFKGMNVSQVFNAINNTGLEALTLHSVSEIFDDMGLPSDTLSLAKEKREFIKQYVCSAISTCQNRTQAYIAGQIQEALNIWELIKTV